MQVESGGATGVSRFVDAVYLRPGVPGEGELLKVLNGITVSGGKNEFLHRALNRGLTILKTRIAELQSQDKTEEEILKIFSLEANEDLYRAAYLYFKALNNMQNESDLQNSAPKVMQEGVQEKPIETAQQKPLAVAEVEPVEAVPVSVTDTPEAVVVTKKSVRNWSGLKGLATGNSGGNNEPA